MDSEASRLRVAAFRRGATQADLSAWANCQMNAVQPALEHAPDARDDEAVAIADSERDDAASGEETARRRDYPVRTVVLWSAASLLAGVVIATSIGALFASTVPTVPVATVLTRDSSLVIFAELPPPDEPSSRTFAVPQDPAVPTAYTITQQRVIGTDRDRIVYGGIGVTNVGAYQDPVFESSVCLAVEDPDGSSFSDCAPHAD